MGPSYWTWDAELSEDVGAVHELALIVATGNHSSLKDKITNLQFLDKAIMCLQLHRISVLMRCFEHQIVTIHQAHRESFVRHPNVGCKCASAGCAEDALIHLTGVTPYDLGDSLRPRC